MRISDITGLFRSPTHSMHTREASTESITIQPPPSTTTKSPVLHNPPGRSRELALRDSHRKRSPSDLREASFALIDSIGAALIDGNENAVREKSKQLEDFLRQLIDCDGAKEDVTHALQTALSYHLMQADAHQKDHEDPRRAEQLTDIRQAIEFITGSSEIDPGFINTVRYLINLRPKSYVSEKRMALRHELAEIQVSAKGKGKMSIREQEITTQLDILDKLLPETAPLFISPSTRVHTLAGRRLSVGSSAAKSPSLSATSETPQDDRSQKRRTIHVTAGIRSQATSARSNTSYFISPHSAGLALSDSQFTILSQFRANKRSELEHLFKEIDVKRDIFSDMPSEGNLTKIGNGGFATVYNFIEDPLSNTPELPKDTPKVFKLCVDTNPDNRKLNDQARKIATEKRQSDQRKRQQKYGHMSDFELMDAVRDKLILDKLESIATEYDITRKVASVPQAMKVYGMYRIADDKYGIIAEKIDGPALDAENTASLKTALEKSSQDSGISPEEYVRFYLCAAFDLLDAIDGFSKCGVVHSDLKGENVLLDKQTGMFKVVDFGLGCYIGEKKRPGGTFGFIDLDDLSASPASDAYSVGMGLHRWLTGVEMSADTKEKLESDKLKADQIPFLGSLSALSSEAKADIAELLDGLVAPARSGRRKSPASMLKSPIFASLGISQSMDRRKILQIEEKAQASK